MSYALRFCALLLAVAAATTQAAGPLLTTDKPGDPQPLRWDTTKGPIRVYTDIGDYARRLDGSTFLDNAQADRITAFALQQWSSVPTSTWRAVTDPASFGKFDKLKGVGVDVVDGATASLVYGHLLQGGLYVIYDQTGDVVEQVFGVPRDQVLGIAFAEFADDVNQDGYPETIIKATAVMNGYVVSTEEPDPDFGGPPPDVDGHRIAGVFTHEFGHAINLSHSQVNGQMAYFSYPGYGQDLYPGVPGCVDGVYAWNYADPAVTRMDPRYIETMYPFIDPNNLDADGHNAGEEMSTVDRPDDIAAISDLYPTADYKKRSSIAGTLYLKDGHTPYDGINVVARNVADPLGDAVSAMTGDKTQGKIGPDGRFRINNLTPGARYVVYIEEIVAGGFPTEPTGLVSEAEYWNQGETSSAAADNACLSTAMSMRARVVKTANFYYNGYPDGVQYTPVTNGYLGALSKDGKRAAGVLDNVPFAWDLTKGVRMPPAGVSGTNASLSRDGSRLIVQTDKDGVPTTDPWTGLPTRTNAAGIWEPKTNTVIDLGNLNGNTCFGSNQTGPASSFGWALDSKGKTAVGTAYVDRNGDGSCEGGYDDETGTVIGGEIIPFIWTQSRGMRALSLNGVDLDNEPWHRAQAISGDGRVVLGNSNFQKAYAWIDEGDPIDLYAAIGALDGGYAMTPNASRVALETEHDGVVFWNANLGTEPAAFTPTRVLQWCVDLPFYDFGFSCDVDGAEFIQQTFGPIPVYTNDINDDGTVMIARAGSFFESGFHGYLWIEGLDWIKLSDFFRSQGVPEAYRLGLDGPASISGAGDKIVGGIPGYPLTWYVDMHQVYVCKNGQSVATTFPKGFVDAVKAGAAMGRCEQLS
ncbi:MAG: hypothetical protein JSR18_13875 [Proteobacteria bacterium]|nr:hypothetical protein [Pseudomonadota bacterium]